MQPFLLIKQTLDSTYDPGALLLDGGNVRFSAGDQIFSKSTKGEGVRSFGLSVENDAGATRSVSFSQNPPSPVMVQEVRWSDGDDSNVLRPDMTHEEIVKEAPSIMRMVRSTSLRDHKKFKLSLIRERFSLITEMKREDAEMGIRLSPLGMNSSGLGISQFARGLIHLPGLRGNPRRDYPVSGIGAAFPGTFDSYTASLIATWQANKDTERLEALGKDLMSLGLTWKVQANPINETKVELLVGRLPKSARGGAKDMVSIADVGFGVSQTLPVLVALHAARPGQTVYLEQPEIHLHPRAQLALAGVLVAAIKRGVRIIVETHSSVLLLGLQTLVANDEVEPENIALHWFKRNVDTGWTEVASAEMDETGAFGDWPVDFGDVTMHAENAYLSAADAKLFKHKS